jgi:hypothetical protein
MRDSAFSASRFFPTFDEVPNAFNREKLSKRRRGVHTVPPDNRVLPECIIINPAILDHASYAA